MRLSDVLYVIIQPQHLMQSPLITEFRAIGRRHPFNLDVGPCLDAVCTDWQVLQKTIMAMSREAIIEHK